MSELGLFSTTHCCTFRSRPKTWYLTRLTVDNLYTLNSVRCSIDLSRYSAMISTCCSYISKMLHLAFIFTYSGTITNLKITFPELIFRNGPCAEMTLKSVHLFSAFSFKFSLFTALDIDSIHVIDELPFDLTHVILSIKKILLNVKVFINRFFVVQVMISTNAPCIVSINLAMQNLAPLLFATFWSNINSSSK